MSEVFQSLVRFYHVALERYRHRPFLRAAMAACALVATAGGHVTFRQRVRLDLVIETLDALKVFDPHEGVELFNGFVEQLESGGESAQRAVRELISEEVDGNAETARLLVRICLAVSERDGTIPAAQRHEIEELCRWIGIGVDAACFSPLGQKS